MTDEIDTTNKFLVGVMGDGIVFLRPVPRTLTRDDALLLAAYLVAMVCDDARWDAVRKAVESV